MSSGLTTGRCHLCKTDQPVAFCPQCGHWFCHGCRGRYTARAWEALKEVIQGRVTGACCGPLVSSGSLFSVVE
jgi:hypothetical protein